MLITVYSVLILKLNTTTTVVSYVGCPHNIVYIDSNSTASVCQYLVVRVEGVEHTLQVS